MERSATVELVTGVSPSAGTYGSGTFGTGTFGQVGGDPGFAAYRFYAVPLTMTDPDP